ncbi:hypothetical protein K488DRAFT_23771, partial [Vararia minispora EC-137]
IESLPAEILTYIFEMAVDDEAVFSWAVPTSMKESYWDVRRGEFVLIDPITDLHVKQRRKYAMTKSLMLTSRHWYQLAYHLLFQTIFISDSADIPAVCIAFERTEDLGWYVQRLHVVRWYEPRGLSMSHLSAMLVSIIQQCPNLILFTVEWSLMTAFPDVANSLSMFASHTLRSLHVNLTPNHLSRFIWALECLPELFSVHVDITTQAGVEYEPAEITPRLGAASNLSLELPHLQQLSFRGYVQALLEQTCGWSLPALRAVTIDLGSQLNDIPDILAFLTVQGTTLLFLDLNIIPTVDIAGVLARCPFLNSFAFSADWRLPFHDAEPPGSLPFVHAPHAHLRHIGLHQLLHAFHPPRGDAAISAVQRINDTTFAQLTKKNFPNLTLVRVLSRPLLAALERNNGPEEDEGLARWQRWDRQCQLAGIRLEDCTGAPLGELPEDEDSLE